MLFDVGLAYKIWEAGYNYEEMEVVLLRHHCIPPHFYEWAVVE